VEIVPPLVQKAKVARRGLAEKAKAAATNRSSRKILLLQLQQKQQKEHSSRGYAERAKNARPFRKNRSKSLPVSAAKQTGCHSDGKGESGKSGREKTAKKN
jgi:hypothetical protein